MPTATKKKTRKRATLGVTPRNAMPASPNGNGRKAKELLPTSPLMPSTPPDDGGGHESRDTHSVCAAALIAAIREDWVFRQSLVRMQIRIDNQCRSYVRRVLGWRVDAPEAERKRINVLAAKTMKAVQTGQPDNDNQTGSAGLVTAFCLMSLESRAPFDRERKKVEKRLKAAAEQLPVWPLLEPIRGFGSFGLSVIVGECGDLNNYPNPGKLWKRAGLAPTSCYEIVKKDGEIVPGGKPRSRRSAIWTIGDSLIKASGDYKKLYDERKGYERERHPDFKPIKHHRYAQKYMEKRLLREIWRAWHGQEGDGHAANANHESDAIT